MLQLWFQSFLLYSLDENLLLFTNIIDLNRNLQVAFDFLCQNGGFVLIDGRSIDLIQIIIIDLRVTSKAHQGYVIS